jgi:hypothetical protein
MPGVFEPLVPKSWIAPAQEALDKRRLDQSPLEAKIRGFGAGALEGLRGLTTPAQLASLALPVGRGAMGIMRGAKAAGPALELLAAESPIAQASPSIDEVGSLLGQLKGNLSKVPLAASKLPKVNLPHEFAPTTAPTAVGGLKRAVSPYAEEMYSKFMSNLR